MSVKLVNSCEDWRRLLAIIKFSVSAYGNDNDDFLSQDQLHQKE